MKTFFLLWCACSGLTGAVLAVVAARAERRQARATAALRRGRITMRAGGVIQRRHPSECSDCGDDRRGADGLCWTCAGGNRQPKGVHREAAA